MPISILVTVLRPIIESFTLQTTGQRWRISGITVEMGLRTLKVNFFPYTLLSMVYVPVVASFAGCGNCFFFFSFATIFTF